MAIGETLSRLLLKRLVDDVFTTGGVEPLDAVVDFLTRCGQQSDPRLTAALEQAMQRAWWAVEAALSGEPSADRCVQALRRCLGRVFAELAQGGDQSMALTVASALRRQCVNDLLFARAGGALAGCLDREEWARSPEVFVRFAAAEVRPDKRRRTEVQLLRDLEHQGCVGLMRLFTNGTGLPLLLMTARAFLCQELSQLLYFCLRECPEQAPANSTLVLDILEELSQPCFSAWRAPALRPKPVHWSRLERIGNAGDGAPIYPFAPKVPRESINRRAAARASWALVAVLTIAAALLVVLPVWMLVENAQNYTREQQRAALRRQRLRDERRRVDAEQQRSIEEQRQMVRREEAQRRALRRQHEQAARRRQLEEEQQRRHAAEQAEQEREQQRRRMAEEARARLREEEQRREQAQDALQDGLTQSALRKDREALTTLNKALRLDPRLHRAWSERGAVRRRLGDAAGALEDFSEAIRLDPADVRSRLQCGELHAERREYHRAIEEFTAVVRLESKNVSAYRQRGLCFAQCNRVDEALADQTRVIELAPDDPLAYYHRANLHRRRKDLDRALDDYTAAIDRDRGNSGKLACAYRERGMLYQRWHSPARAISDLTRALRLDPADSSALRARCLAYLHNGEWANALVDANGLIRLDVEDGAAYKMRGQAYMGLREFSRADRDFSRSLRKQRDAETFYLRACVKVYLGDIQEAIFDCNDATAINPRLASAFYLRGTLNLHEGYPISGLADCRTAHELDPQFPSP